LIVKQKKAPKKNKKSKTTPDSVHIDSPADGGSVSSSFTASGSGNPDGASVTGILTDTVTGATIQCNPATATIVLGTWNLNFEDVPAGTYVLAVNETDPNTGADAVNITVTAVVSLTIDPPKFSGSTATVTGTCDTATTVSGVISGSKPKFGNPVKQKGKNKYSIDFDGLTSGKKYTVTVYPIRDYASGGSTSFTMP
jgi:hypothetical protein